MRVVEIVQEAFRTSQRGCIFQVNSAAPAMQILLNDGGIVVSHQSCSGSLIVASASCDLEVMG